jgi:hypothetical protein
MTSYDFSKKVAIESRALPFPRTPLSGPKQPMKKVKVLASTPPKEVKTGTRYNQVRPDGTRFNDSNRTIWSLCMMYYLMY